jgi:hypothetical protein
VHLFE